MEQTAIVALVGDLCLSADKGYASLLLPLQLSAAFDAVDHAILLRHLEDWFKLFLRDQTHRVATGDQLSS